MKSRKLLISQILFCLVLVQVKGQVDHQNGLHIIEPAVSNSNTSSSMGSSGDFVKIVDFIRFDQTLHEAEFIFTYTFSNISGDELNLGLGSYRSLTLLQKEILPFSRDNSTKQFQTQEKYRVTVKCKTFLILYPHDSHLCVLQFKLGSGSGNKVWKQDDMPPICGDLSSYNFHLKGYLSAPLPGGVLLVNLILERTSGVQIGSQMYSPLISLVALSFFTLSKRGSFTFRIWTSIACMLGLYLVTTILWNDIPRTGESGQTAIEHYIIICIGLTFQVVLTNILIYGYLSLGKPEAEDVEANNVLDLTKQNGPDLKKSKNSSKIKPYEMHILKMGKCHQFIYFKCLKPAKYQLPIAFLVINIIYWVIILWVTSGLPKGFQSPPHHQSTSPLDLSCI